jgi:hypothetical protein
MSAGAPEEEGFLGRWSRRKRELAEPDAARSRTPLAAPPPDEAALQAAEPAPPEPEPEVEPPSLDLVDKDFDLAPWLKRNVPESWKLAALRRAWESDPAIAGFENPARDYALDWNTPGGAPGYGPLTESDDVGEMLRGIFGEAKQPEALPESAAAAGERAATNRLSSNDKKPADDAAVQGEEAETASADAVRLTEQGATPEIPAAAQSDARQPVYAAVQNSPDENASSMRLRKRGGGAVPI